MRAVGRFCWGFPAREEGPKAALSTFRGVLLRGASSDLIEVLVKLHEIAWRWHPAWFPACCVDEGDWDGITHSTTIQLLFFLGAPFLLLKPS